MSRHTGSHCDTVVEFLKLMRSGWRTQHDIQQAMGWCEITVSRWVKEMHANGLLVARLGQRRTGRTGERPGRAPYVYSLSPEWGGEVCQEENVRHEQHARTD